MTRRAIVISLVCAAVAALAVTACGSSGGPLVNMVAGGQPEFPVDGTYASPGQSADFDVGVRNTAGPVTVVSASLIPISGHPVGRLIFVAVPLQRGVGMVGGRGFPVPKLPTRPFRGARLSHGINSIIFGFAGNRIGGFYMVTGLHVTYRYHGRLYAMDAWSASTSCVIRNWRDSDNVNPGPCNRAGDIDRRYRAPRGRQLMKGFIAP